ncbi:hypothetical protein IVB22_27000 [Bradyrhizobium sp. 190]|uniref:hypothetical protein n=1 Tax=Bradyrhizobium sp. 190 TaxID=2782658 RepID=UPI001FF70CDB|nr:hypothetical protein [Bradyrhizobium sp. 190]MCK1516124.1 hypothetical protein [Bradyrhizobium sp. 190]
MSSARNHNEQRKEIVPKMSGPDWSSQDRTYQPWGRAEEEAERLRIDSYQEKPFQLRGGVQRCIVRGARKNHFLSAARTDRTTGTVWMLNDADTYQGGGNAGEPKEKLNDAEALFGRLKRQVFAAPIVCQPPSGP